MATEKQAALLDSPAAASRWRRALAKRRVTPAVVVGAFDLLQPANFAAIIEARRRSPAVCVLMEDTVSGKRKIPLNKASDRLQILRSLSPVSCVMRASAGNLRRHLDALRPYTLVFCPAQKSYTPALAEAALFASRRIELPYLPRCSTGDIIRAIHRGHTPITIPKQWRARTREWRRPARTLALVTVNGCFDILHPGHMRFLERARRKGDGLVVLLNDDASVRRYKGTDRPVFPAVFRAAVLAALRWVSGVVPFGEDNPLCALDKVRPAIHVKGGRYERTRVEDEMKTVRRWGSRVEFCPIDGAYSTTRHIKRLLGA